MFGQDSVRGTWNARHVATLAGLLLAEELMPQVELATHTEMGHERTRKWCPLVPFCVPSGQWTPS
jgi:hypothetical protein